MEFINENLVWFAVGGTILFMALIGFIAEKTDFGRKPKKVKEEKKELKQETPVVEEVIIAPKEELKVENVIPTVEDLMNEKEIVVEEPTMPTLEEIAPMALEENVVSESVIEEAPLMEEIVSEPTIEETPVFEEITSEPTIEEVSFENSASENVVNEKIVESEAATDDVVVNEEKKEEFDLPTLEEVLAENDANKNQEVSEPEEHEEIDEDSLWKF